ncbi:hypothetical protein Vadar_017505 [Vaccinium darrowii]|uniref:Uncharacterized protein n=1 Tax=Vaccinium darrowii TaxID=229202 RepID=A0ACB7ZCG2_9ERIC|nr:hypothetical protein Vadar_017505 [Vaccinium darrowii]
MSTAVSTKPPSPKEPTAELNVTVSQLISNLKSSFRLSDFERVTHILTARDEDARKQTSYWKARFEAMEKKHGEIALEKIIADDELHKLKRERDLLKGELALAETGRKESWEREKKWKERYEKLGEDFERVEMEKASLGRRVAALELEKDKTDREAEELNRRISQLEDDAVLLSAGVEERTEEGLRPVAVAEMGGAVVADDELLMDGKEGGGGDENLTEPVVKESGSKCGEKAESLPPAGGSAPVSVEVEISHRENGPKVIIEIDDSDDEVPTRKRVKSIDDNDGVKPPKKHHISLEELMENMTDGSDSSDTGDSSSSGSDIDSKIAKVESVCRSSLSMNRGFNQFDALRGTSLGKYLTDGNPQGK